MKRFVLLALCVFPLTVLAQRVSNDLLSYAPPPASWQKEVKEHRFTSYGIVNQREYCQIFVLVGDKSTGDIAGDFEREWKNLVVANYAVAGPPTLTQTATEPGWQARAGVGNFEYAGGVSVAMLTTITGYGRTASIVAVTNSKAYTPVIQSVLASVKMNPVPHATKPAAAPAPGPAATSKQKAQPTALQGYMDYSPFTRTWTWKVRYAPPK